MTPASGRIVVAGDWHAHTRWATRVIEAARDRREPNADATPSPKDET